MSRILYPIKTEPVLTDAQRPEQVTESRWHRPFSEPVRRRAIVTAVAVASGLFAPVYTPEVGTTDKWFMPLSQPVLRKSAISTLPSLFFVKADPFPEAVSIDKWQQPFSQPRFPRGLATSSQQTFAFVKADPFPEAVSIDRWQQPISLPTLRRGFPVQEQVASVLGRTDVARDARWFSPFSEPTRRKRTVHPDAAAWSGYTPPSAEVVTIDKWFSPPSRPTLPLYRGLPAHQQLSLAFVKAAPFGETVFLDKWFVPLSAPVLPLYRGLHVSNQTALAFVKAEPFATIPPTPDRRRLVQAIYYDAPIEAFLALRDGVSRLELRDSSSRIILNRET